MHVARSAAKAEGRVKRALDVNAATPRARQAAEQQHPGPSQPAVSSEAPAASETGSARESALGNGPKGSAAGAPPSKGLCAPTPEGSTHPSGVIAPVFTEVSIPGLSDLVQPRPAAANQATASKQPGSASTASAETSQAAVEAAEGTSQAGAAVEGPAPAACEDHSAPHTVQAAKTASPAPAASGVATSGGLAAAGASVPMESKIYSRATAVGEPPSRAMAAAHLQPAEQAVAMAQATADGVSLRSADPATAKLHVESEGQAGNAVPRHTGAIWIALVSWTWKP